MGWPLLASLLEVIYWVRKKREPNGRMTSRVSRPWFAAFAASLLPAAIAQLAPNQLEVVGLRLGMTVEQAKARIVASKPGIWTVIGYATEDRNTWNYCGVLPQSDAGRYGGSYPFHDAEVRVPVCLGAWSIDKAYPSAVTGTRKEVGDPNTPIDSFSGELLTLFFTPTDDGGRLYAIVRRRVYFSDPSRTLRAYADANVAMPKAASIEKDVVEQYGQPSLVDHEKLFTSLHWIYPQGAIRPVERLGGLSQCESRLADVDNSRPLTYQSNKLLWSEKNNAYLTLRQLAVSFEDRDFYKLGYNDTITDLDSNVRKLFQILPGLVVEHPRYHVPRGPHDTFRENEFDSCGIQLHVVINSTTYAPEQNEGYAPVVTISLSDQRAMFFDNGTAEYMDRKIKGVTPKLASPPKEKN